MTAALALAVLLAAQSQQLPRPAFETNVNVVLVDVHVVDKHGKPITDLRPEEFEVQISGRTRQVQSVQFVSYAAPLLEKATVDPAAPPDSAAARPRRMFILAIDEHSLHVANARAAVLAAEKFIDKLQPDDLVGLYAYPTGKAQHDLTTDHAAVRRTLQQVTGLFQQPVSRYNLTPSEIIDISSGDTEAARRVVLRECRGGGCSVNDIRNEAIGLVGFMEMAVSQSVGGLRGLVRALGDIPGRKTLVLVSGGLVSTDKGSGRANAAAEITALGREAAIANLSVFALHLDWSFQEAMSSRGGVRLSYFRDSGMAATGLEMVAGTTGGTVVRVQGQSPDVA
ncbi:MAG: VWA domain-containing protein, partial [Vicinamibacterales bacterium]